MKKYLLTLLTFVLFIGVALAQQMPQISAVGDFKHLWNPAFTGQTTELQFSGIFRQQWLGFDNAPRTIFASAQYPFLDMNMSAGGAIIADKTGPTSRTGLQLNYAYKMRELLGRDDQLSLGISAFAFQYAYNPANEVFNDNGDPLVFSSRQSSFYPSIGFGFSYISNTEKFDGNVFYVGFASQQALAREILLSGGDFKRERHYFASIGTQLYGFDYFIEPFINLNYTSPELIDLMIGAKFEMHKVFWAGMAYSSVSAFSIQGGYIFDEIGGRDTALRLGAVANLSTNSALGGIGPGFEFIVAYLFDLD